ncbi:pyroglutamyl-peptidase I [bacterium]|nr:pyroglutamyl-peptidase I [bacterium]
MKILLTGFEPFGESAINPSQMLVETAPDSLGDNVSLFRTILPVDKDRGPAKLVAALNDHQPDAVLCFGLALGRPKISLERVAVNLMDYRLPDNAGNTIQDTPIEPDGPAAYFSTLPLRTMLTSLQNAGIPTELSLSAGTYLCNQVFYTLMNTLSSREKSIPAGFIHLPALPEQAAQRDNPTPSMSFDMEQKALELLIQTLIKT